MINIKESEKIYWKEDIKEFFLDTNNLGKNIGIYSESRGFKKLIFGKLVSVKQKYDYQITLVYGGLSNTVNLSEIREINIETKLCLTN